MKKLSQGSCQRTGRVSPSDQHRKSFSVDLLLSCPTDEQDQLGGGEQPCHWFYVQTSPRQAAALAPSLPQGL